MGPAARIRRAGQSDSMLNGVGTSHGKVCLVTAKVTVGGIRGQSAQANLEYKLVTGTPNSARLADYWKFVVAIGCPVPLDPELHGESAVQVHRRQGDTVRA